VIDLAPYVRFEAAHQHPRIAAWLSPEAIAENLRAELGEELALRTEPAQAERYRRHCPVAGVAADAYMLRELDLGADGKAMAGIHFVGMDVRRPFVGVFARTQPLATPAALARLARRLRDELAAFQPERWRLWSTQADTAVERAPRARVGMFVVAGRLGELRARPPRPVPIAVALRPCRAAHVYAEYLEVFERFFDAHPRWRGRIQVETEERLAEAEAGGVLRRALVDGAHAGFFAAVPARERALTGFVMLEEILDTPFRGKGLAPTLQRMLLDDLAERSADPSAVVFGHIEHDNTPSLRTALAVGRHEVYRTVYLPFD